MNPQLVLNMIASQPTVSPAFAKLIAVTGPPAPSPLDRARLMQLVSDMFWKSGDPLADAVEIGRLVGLSPTEVYQALRDGKPEPKDAPLVRLGPGGDFTRDKHG